jgi:F0F1-type ATP synthase assembly protein I
MPADPEHLPEPDEVHPREGQRAGGPGDALVPQEIIETEGGIGLQPGTLMDDLRAVVRLGRQAGPWAGAIFRDIGRRLNRVERLQEELTQEKVDHARTDERLRQHQMQSGAQAMLTALGGTFLGLALGELRTEASWFYVVIALIGLAMIAVGCWPILSARAGRKHPRGQNG